MLSEIRTLINQKEEFQESASLILEDMTDGALEAIILGEDADTLPVELVEGEEPEPELDDGGDDPDLELPEGEEHPMEGDDLGGEPAGEDDLMSAGVDDEVPDPGMGEEPIDDDPDNIDDLMNVTIDIRTNTVTDILPAPPGGTAPLLAESVDLMSMEVFSESPKEEAIKKARAHFRDLYHGPDGDKYKVKADSPAFQYSKSFGKWLNSSEGKGIVKDALEALGESGISPEAFQTIIMEANPDLNALKDEMNRCEDEFKRAQEKYSTDQSPSVQRTRNDAESKYNNATQKYQKALKESTSEADTYDGIQNPGTPGSQGPKGSGHTAHSNTEDQTPQHSKLMSANADKVYNAGRNSYVNENITLGGEGGEGPAPEGDVAEPQVVSVGAEGDPAAAPDPAAGGEEPNQITQAVADKVSDVGGDVEGGEGAPTSVVDRALDKLDDLQKKVMATRDDIKRTLRGETTV